MRMLSEAKAWACKPFPSILHHLPCKGSVVSVEGWQTAVQGTNPVCCLIL